MNIGGCLTGKEKAACSGSLARVKTFLPLIAWVPTPTAISIANVVCAGAAAAVSHERAFGRLGH
jgi:hypothetical protein